MPPGLLATDPEPEPPTLTVSARCPVNMAVTLVSPSRVSVQLPVPAQPAPDQPAKLDPGEGAAVSVTAVPWS
jgi:hypothetical protein